MIQKISSRHSLTFWTFAVPLALNAVIPFFHRTLRLIMLYHQTKFGCKWTSSLEDTTEIVIFWSYKPMLWPWHWTQWTNFSAWHSGSCWSMSIPGLATKRSVVQKIWSGQMFTNILNLLCDLDLNTVIYFFSQKTPANDAVLSNQVWLQMDQQFRRYSKNSHILIYKPSQWPWKNKKNNIYVWWTL